MTQPVISLIIEATHQLENLPRGEIQYIGTHPETLKQAVKNLQHAIKEFEQYKD